MSGMLLFGIGIWLGSIVFAIVACHYFFPRIKKD